MSAAEGLAYGLVLQAIDIASALALGIPALLRELLSPRELRRYARRNPGSTADGHA